MRVEYSMLIVERVYFTIYRNGYINKIFFKKINYIAGPYVVCEY